MSAYCVFKGMENISQNNNTDKDPENNNGLFGQRTLMVIAATSMTI